MAVMAVFAKVILSKNGPRCIRTKPATTIHRPSQPNAATLAKGSLHSKAAINTNPKHLDPKTPSHA